MTKKKRTGLGRGISSFISDIEMSETYPDFIMCPIDEIEPNQFQPRWVFKEEELQRLKESIAQQGVLQPLIIRNKGKSYELIAGERRLRAAKLNNLTHVPALVKTMTDEQVLEVSIIENVQRENLNVLEEAEAYFRLMDEFQYTQEKIAEKVGKDRSTIANLLRLRYLPEKIKTSLIAQKISTGHARAILGVQTQEDQLDLFKIVLQKNLSVRQTERLVKEYKNKKLQVQGKISPSQKRFFDKACSMLSEQINSKVQIKLNGEKGVIQINFNSKAEFQRLMTIFNNSK